MWRSYWLSIPLSLLLGCFLITSVNAQSIKVSGVIKDKSTGEDLSYVNIYASQATIGAVSNPYGFFSLQLPPEGSHQLVFSHIGYLSDTIQIVSMRDTTLTISLESAVNLPTLEVKYSSNMSSTERPQMSTLTLLANDIKEIPAVLGEVDVIKALQLLPGVQGGNEGFSGLYVRGGAQDQNLILLDGVPIYNASHFLGLFSVFNADIIRDVQLIKGGFPARYGGRLSSVLEINTKEGNLNQIEGEGSVSMIASKFSLNGPIARDKTSFLVSGRYSYVGLLLDIVQPDDLSTNFYDLNAKLRHQINEDNHLYFSFYNGADRLGSTTIDENERYGGSLDWNNIVSSLRWNRKIKANLFSNLNLNYSKYDVVSRSFEEENEISNQSRYVSGIEDLGLSWNLDFVPSTQHALKTGGNLIHHTYRPGALSLSSRTTDQQIDTLLGNQAIQSIEYNVYVEDEWNISPAFTANVGSHFSGFAVEDEHYTSLQARLSMRYQFNQAVALKASFANMAQYINLLSNENLGLPTDLWVPSTSRIKPQTAYQGALGMAAKVKEGIQVTAETFYKKMQNIISYQEGAQFLIDLQENWEDKVTQGQGESYGLEVFAEKKAGKTTGWLGYTLSWNWRLFEDINGGRRFPFRYDRRHDISLALNHKRNDRVAYSLSWQFGTGNAVSIPEFRYATNPVNDPARPGLSTSGYLSPDRYVITEKNGFRMSNYHRMDASVTFTIEKKHFTRKWIISVYNVYGHINPYFVQADVDFIYDEFGRATGRNTTLKEVGLIPLIPSIAYSFKF